MRLFVRLVGTAIIFFTLFAFSLNNLQPATVRWFFGIEGRAPMVIIVLVTFTAGCAFGVLAMVPSWWRHRRKAKRYAPPPAPAPEVPPPTSVMPSQFGPEHPPRVGL